MSESNDYKTFKKNALMPYDRCNRIENAVCVGMPDINVCIEGVESWIEMKSPIEPKRHATPLLGSNHKLSVEQRNWMLTQHKAGGIGWVMFSTDKRWILMPGVFGDQMNEMTVIELLIRSRWDAVKPIRDKDLWTKLRQVLSTKRLPSNTSLSA